MILKLSSLCADSWWYNWPIPFSPHKEPTCRVYSPGGAYIQQTPILPREGAAQGRGRGVLSECEGATGKNGERLLSSGGLLG